MITPALTRMHIGWDLDDVTTNLTEELLKLYNLRSGGGHRAEDAGDWSFFPEEVHEEMRAGGYPGLGLKESARSALSELKARGDRVSIITYREPRHREETEMWLEEQVPGLYDGVYLAGGSKAAICKEIGVDVLVDDSPRQVLDAAREGIHAILFATCMNRGFEDTDLIHTARGHREVLELIDLLRAQLKG